MRLWFTLFPSFTICDSESEASAGPPLCGGDSGSMSTWIRFPIFTSIFISGSLFTWLWFTIFTSSRKMDPGKPARGLPPQAGTGRPEIGFGKLLVGSLGRAWL